MKLFRFLFKFIFGLIITVILIVLVTVGVLYFMLKDSTNKQDADIVNDNYSLEQAFEVASYDALETTKGENGIINYAFSEKDLNYILYSVAKEIDIPEVEIKGLYSEYYENNTMELSLPAKVKFFKTRIHAKMEIEANEAGDTMVINLTAVKAGKLKFNNVLTKNVIAKYFDDEKIEEELRKNGLELDVNYDKNKNKFTVTITAEDILKSIKKFTAEENEIYATILDIALKNPQTYSLHFDPVGKGFVVNLNTLSSTIDNNYSFENNISESMDSLTAKTESLIKSGIITQDNSSLVLNFLVRGYDVLSDSKKSRIEALDLSSIGITNNKLYKGVLKDYKVDVDQLIEDQKPEMVDFIANKAATFKFTNTMINSVIHDEDGAAYLIGETYTFNNHELVNYITIGDIYVEFHDNYATINFIGSVNGKELLIVAKAELASTANDTLKLRVTDIHCGTLTLDSNQINSVLNLIKNSLENDVFVIDSSNTICLDMTEYAVEKEEFIDPSTEATLLALAGKTSLEIVRSYKLVEGALEISYSLEMK